MLKIDRLSKKTGTNWELRDVSVEVETGTIFGLFGTANSGISTLFEVLAGSEKPTLGSIVIDSTDVTNRGAGAFLFPGKHRKSAFTRIFERTADAKAEWNAMIASARSHVNESAILLLDGPFSGLDMRASEDRLMELQELADKRSATIILASNNYLDILNACDEAAVFIGGEIMQVGAPQSIYDRPSNRRVAEAVGRCNLIEVRRLTSSKSAVPEFITISGEHRIFAKKTDIERMGAINCNVFLGIRPEQIEITFGASFPEDNLVRAEVRDIRPRGDHTLIDLDSNGLVLEASVTRIVGLNVGDECMVGLPPDRIMIFSD